MPLRTGGPAVPGARGPKRADSTPSAAGQGRAPWNGRIGRAVAAAGRPAAICGQRGLQLPLRVLELAGQLGVEVAPRVDRFDQLGAGRHRALDRRARVLGLSLQRRQLLRARLQLAALLDQRRHRPAMLLDAIAVDAPERRRRAIGAADLAQVLDVEQQPPVAGAPQLVDLHQPRFDVGPLPVRFSLRAPRSAPSPRRAAPGRRRPPLDLLELRRP